jgi:peroxiredoxin
MDLMVVALVLPWLVLGVGFWIGYQLVRQNGRILLRLDELEAALGPRLPGRALQAGAPQTARPRGLPVGAEAPAFELPDLTGTLRSLAEWRGRRVLLVFFSPHCGFCQQMLPALTALPADPADGRPLPVVITAGDEAANRTWVAEHRVAAPVLLAGESDVATRYASHGTPTGYLIDEAGRLASGLTVGSHALLTLAGADGPEARPAASATASPGAPHGQRPPALMTLKPLTESRLKRDGLPAGTPAPAFTLPTLDGSALSLETYRGRRVLLVFSDPHCGPCDVLAPQLEAVHRRTPQVPVLMVSRGEVEENLRKARQHGLTFPVVLQRQWEISRAYAMFATPVGYLVDEAGVIAADVATGATAVLDLFAHAAAGTSGTNGRGTVPAGDALEPAGRD